MNHHHIIRPADVFTDSGWQEIQSRINSMPNIGGCIVVLLNITPDRTNYISGTITSHDHDERKVLRKALERLRAKREGQSVK